VMKLRQASGSKDHTYVSAFSLGRTNETNVAHAVNFIMNKYTTIEQDDRYHTAYTYSNVGAPFVQKFCTSSRKFAVIVR